MTLTQIYQLSEAGRAITFTQWLKMGGCGISHWGQAMISRKLGPEAHWPADTTLGQLADAWPAEGRHMARFAVEILNRADLAEPYVSEFPSPRF